MANEKVLARCDDYNGFKNVLFVMDADDFRIGNGNYHKLADGVFSRKNHHFTANDGRQFKVFADRSAKPV